MGGRSVTIQHSPEMMLRVLTAEDELLLESFLWERRDSSMFLRANARQSGLARATYVAAFRGGAIVAVVAHGPTGMIQLQAPESVVELARFCVEHASGARSACHCDSFARPEPACTE